MRKKRQKQIFLGIIAFILGFGLIATISNYMPYKTIEACGTGDFSYIDFYIYNGDNATVGDNILTITNYDNVVSKAFNVFADKISFQVQVFKDGHKYIGYIYADIEQNTSIIVNDVVIEVSYIRYFETFPNSNGVTYLSGVMMGMLLAVVAVGYVQSIDSSEWRKYEGE